MASFAASFGGQPTGGSQFSPFAPAASSAAPASGSTFLGVPPPASLPPLGSSLTPGWSLPAHPTLGTPKVNSLAQLPGFGVAGGLAESAAAMGHLNNAPALSGTFGSSSLGGLNASAGFSGVSTPGFGSTQQGSFGATQGFGSTAGLGGMQGSMLAASMQAQQANNSFRNENAFWQSIGPRLESSLNVLNESQQRNKVALETRFRSLPHATREKLIRAEEFISQFLEAKESVDVGETGEKMAKLREDVESLVPYLSSLEDLAQRQRTSLERLRRRHDAAGDAAGRLRREAENIARTGVVSSELANLDSDFFESLVQELEIQTRRLEEEVKDIAMIRKASMGTEEVTPEALQRALVSQSTSLHALESRVNRLSDRAKHEREEFKRRRERYEKRFGPTHRFASLQLDVEAHEEELLRVANGDADAMSISVSESGTLAKSVSAAAQQQQQQQKQAMDSSYMGRYLSTSINNFGGNVPVDRVMLNLPTGGAQQQASAWGTSTGGGLAGFGAGTTSTSGFGTSGTALGGFGASGFGAGATTGGFGTSTGGMGGFGASTTGGFGATQLPGGFGNAPTTATSGFGAPASSAFGGMGATTGANAFGQPAASTGAFGSFGAAPATGAFGTTQLPGGFGNAPASAAGSFGASTGLGLSAGLPGGTAGGGTLSANAAMGLGSRRTLAG